jgi:hypothetical protein
MNDHINPVCVFNATSQPSQPVTFTRGPTLPPQYRGPSHRSTEDPPTAVQRTLPPQYRGPATAIYTADTRRWEGVDLEAHGYRRDKVKVCTEMCAIMVEGRFRMVMVEVHLNKINAEAHFAMINAKVHLNIIVVECTTA